ncbi:MAG: asparagine synthase-related protein [Myxococcota bacterium]
MGGVAGIVHFRGEPPVRDQARQLASGVAHRGAHDRGLFMEGAVILTHRRGVGALRQPVSDDRFVVMMDGWLADGDARTVLEQWAKQGERCLSALSGAFALVIWDRRLQALWLVRDAVGQCPLFWSEDTGRLAFCSEMPPLLELPWVSREIAVENLAEYLSFRYVHAPRTLARGVSSVPPGHLVRIDGAGARIQRWWRPPWAAPGAAMPDDDETVGNIDSLLRQEVERCLRSSGPTALLLSGGLDSSSILYHAAQILDRPMTTTISMTASQLDEAPFAARVAKMMGADHEAVRIDDGRFIDALLEATAAMGAPLPNAGGALQWLLFQELRRSVKVVLSGDGGDEVFGGRGMDQIAGRLRRARLIGRLPGPARLFTQAAARRARWNDFGVSAANFGMDRAIGGSRVFHSAERVRLMADPGQVRPGIRRIALEPMYQEIDSDPLNSILHVWQRGWLVEDGLARADRMAARAGLSVRNPMLGAPILQAAAALPGDAKVRANRLGGFVTKWPLRQAMRGRMPRQLLYRPKRSLPNPLGLWLRAPGADFLRGQIDDIQAHDDDLFIPAVVRDLARQHLEGHADHSLQLWSLILFRLWRGTVLRR